MPRTKHPGSCTTTTTVIAVMVLAALALAPAALADADGLTVTYSFDAPTITPVMIEGVEYQRVTMTDCTNGGHAGEPALPACGANILLPFGTDVADVEIIPGEKIALGSGYLVVPVAQPARLMDGVAAALPPTPDETIYSSTAAFPAATFQQISTQSFRGYRYVVLKLQPVEYVPATGELSYYTDLTVVVHTTASATAQALFRGLPQDQQAVLAKVDNATAVASYDQTGYHTRSNYDLLILTTPTLASSFETLRDYHNANGLATEIHTTDEVGSTTPSAVRDYITDCYTNDGISYVIIGADDDIIPARDLYVTTGPYGSTEYNMPADIFYACLDGTYNYDNDSRWGEPTDGDGGGDVDLVGEVYVGRASVGNATEAARFVDKTIWYLNNQHTQPEKVLLVGEYLGFGGASEYAGNTLDELIDGSTAHYYTTVGIPSDIYTIDALYERDYAGHDWPQSVLVGKINDGVHILDHLGHGDVTYAMKLYNSDVTSDLTNTDLCFVYSQTCLAGHFDGSDCWAETMNIKTDHGAFAVIMNARYGFGEYNSTDGPSQRFNREFWDAVYEEGMPELGAANQDSKEDNIYRIGEDCMRWCAYEINLFGDPTLRVKGVSGMRVAPGIGLDATGQDGGPFTPESVTYTLTNVGTDPFDYEITASADWIDITNATGTIPGESSVEVTVSLNAAANLLTHGLHQDTVYFTNTTANEGDTLRIVSIDVDAMHQRFDFPMDTNPGWTTEGQWEFGMPTGTGTHNCDPASGHTGANVYGYNLAGDYANNMSAYSLTTTALDCSNYTEVQLRFWRWLGIERSPFDNASIEVSSDGADWTTIWSNPDGFIADTEWKYYEYDISDIADEQPTVYIRWTIGATDDGTTYPGWNIDDVEIWAVANPPACPADLTGDGLTDLSDLQALLAAYGANDGDANFLPGADFDNNSTIDLSDLQTLLSDYGCGA